MQGCRETATGRQEQEDSSRETGKQQQEQGTGFYPEVLSVGRFNLLIGPLQKRRDLWV